MQSDTRYELPRDRISLLGYLCRRAHKTAILVAAAELVGQREHVAALEAVGRFSLAAAVSYGRAYYQPASSQVGDVYRESDPATGVPVSAELLSRSPAITTRIDIVGPEWSFVIDEEITGTTFGLGTLAMPAPSRFAFDAGDYSASAVGMVTTELIPLPAATRVRGFGQIELSDNQGNRGTSVLTKKGLITTEIGDLATEHRLR